MDQDLENLWLDRYVLSVEQIEDLIKEVDRLRSEGTGTEAELEGRICEMESDLNDQNNQIADLEAKLTARDEILRGIKELLA